MRGTLHELEAANTLLIDPVDSSGGSAAGTILELRSPVDGVVLRRLRESEAVVPQGEPLLEIADPSRLEVIADFLSKDAVGMAPGMQVRLEQWGGDEPLNGRVRRVEPSGFTKISALGVEEQRVWVVIDLDDPPYAWQNLGDGYRVEARVVVWSGQSIVRVPTAALFREGESWAVFVVDGGRARLQTVDIGRRTGLLAEVTDGLEDGRIVINHPPDAVTDGVRVAERDRVDTMRTFTIGEFGTLLGGRLAPGTDPETVIDSVVSSSRHDQKNSLFVAYRGNTVDGHDFISGAFDNGSVAAVVTDAHRLEGRPGVVVDNGQHALSRLCAAFAGDPSRELLTIGITGTNGKTTVHWLLYHALERLGRPGIRIGSLGISAHGEVERSGKVTGSSGLILMTTPGPQEIHESLRQAVDRGLTTCVLETSSHALDQHRVADISYDAAIFTNLSPDHLNYHHDMEQYFQTKVRLFEQLAATKREAGENAGCAAINSDCPYGRRLVEIADELGLQVFTFGTGDKAVVRIRRFEQRFPLGTLILDFPETSTPSPPHWLATTMPATSPPHSPGCSPSDSNQRRPRRL